MSSYSREEFEEVVGWSVLSFPKKKDICGEEMLMCRTGLTLTDLMYVFDPVMLIVGSRGLGKLKGRVSLPTPTKKKESEPNQKPPPSKRILLGSTSHYLIQKSPVPVMVARRRLRRTSARRGSQNPPRSRTPVPLAQATIEKVGPGKAEKDVEAMREEIEREEREEVAGGEPGVRRKGSL
jgi:hypothetical protein